LPHTSRPRLARSGHPILVAELGGRKVIDEVTCAGKTIELVDFTADSETSNSNTAPTSGSSSTGTSTSTRTCTSGSTGR
jgi:hypothetical protein